MSDLPLPPDAPIDADPAAIEPAAEVEAAAPLPAALTVLVDLAMPDDHPDAPGVWPAGTAIAAIHLDPTHIPLLLERGIVAPAAIEPTPDAPAE